MSKRNNLMAYFNNQSKFNDEEKLLQNRFKKNYDDCQNIDSNHLFPDGALPIHYACLYNSTKYLMNHTLPHTQINIPGGAYDSTPIMFTVHNSNYKVLLSLLLNGADIFQRNSRSSDVLSFCVRYDDLFGLILVLSFIDKNISIKRYLRYSWKKNSELTREFLTERRSELEGEVSKKKDSWKIFTLSNLEFIFSWLFIILCLIFVDFKWLFAAFYFFIFYPLIISTPIPSVVIIVFHIYAYYNIIIYRFNNYLTYFFLLVHLILSSKFYLSETPYLEINKIKEAQSLITNLILKDEYNTENFCQKCLRKKLIGNAHCDKCNRCVYGHICHSTLFNKCISTKQNQGLFDFYTFYSVLLYFLACEITLNIDIYTAFVFAFPLAWHFIVYYKFKTAEHNRNIKTLKYINSFDDTIFLENNYDNTNSTVRLPSALDEYLENIESI